LWVLVFEPRQGVINSLLALAGIEGPGWIFDKRWALPSLVIMSLWGAGGGMVIYLSALQSIPTALYEVAKIDGANTLRQLWHITLPLTTPVIFFNLVMGLIGSFQSFTNAFVMTEGGPQNATLFYSLRLYYAAFRDIRMGYASMLAWVLFLIILGLTGFMFKGSTIWVYYEGELNK
jgi:multiple sugar transport system permease protein